MNATRVASRYSEAILDSIPPSVTTDEFLRDILDLKTSIRNSRELLVFFESPVISRKRKSDSLVALFQGRLGEHVLSVLKLLVEKNREKYILVIIDAVINLHLQRSNIMTSKVESAVALSDEQRNALTEALENLSGKHIDADYTVDPSLIGGVLVRIGDTVYDGSIRSGLQRLHARLVAGI